MILDIKDLKSQLESKTFDIATIHFFISDSYNVLVDNYISEIGKLYNIIYIDDVELIPDENPLFDSDITDVYVCRCSEINSNKLQNKIKNLIIISPKVVYGDEINAIEFPKLEPWMVTDYCKHQLPGVKSEDVDYLVSICKNNYTRILKEVSKVSVFNKERQQEMFDALKESNDWDDLQTLKHWDLINYIQRKNLKGISDILSRIEFIDIEGTGVVTLLLQNFKKVIDIQMNPQATAESLGMSPKQFNAITYSCNKFSNTQLINIYEFLTSIDSKLKMGELQLTNSKLVDYIICKVLTL